jgi:hypothetical protein
MLILKTSPQSPLYNWMTSMNSALRASTRPCHTGTRLSLQVPVTRMGIIGALMWCTFTFTMLCLWYLLVANYLACTPATDGA